MSAKRIEITVQEHTWDRIEAARGDVPRAAFIKRAIEAALAKAEASADNTRASVST